MPSALAKFAKVNFTQNMIALAIIYHLTYPGYNIPGVYFDDAKCVSHLSFKIV